MKTKYLRKNIKAVKKELKSLAKDYKLKVEFESSPTNHRMWADFSYKKTPKYKHILVSELAEDKIAYGLYKPGMVRYNLERAIVSWLKSIE